MTARISSTRRCPHVDRRWCPNAPARTQYKKAEKDALLVPTLTMLGAKTTCKDRWRQVTKEAALIETKHLITLEPSISVDQTNEMRSFSVHLVLPRQLHTTYKPSQQQWLLTVDDFLTLLVSKSTTMASG